MCPTQYFINECVNHRKPWMILGRLKRKTGDKFTKSILFIWEKCEATWEPYYCAGIHWERGWGQEVVCDQHVKAISGQNVASVLILQRIYARVYIYIYVCMFI